jgi:hypothetical protein
MATLKTMFLQPENLGQSAVNHFYLPERLKAL